MAVPERPSAALPEWVAPASWRTLEFVSDVHLNADEPATAAAWAKFLATSQADAVFILGDLFEVWIGDDQITTEHEGFVVQRIAELRQCSQRSALFFMPGNRDFLAGEALMRACGARLLADPTVLSLGEQRVLLSHGDALCLSDVRYLAFRDLVRSPDWQQAFLARPLAERQAMARQLREQSRQEQAQRQASGEDPADVDDTAASQLLHNAGATLLIHGHTHRPARHTLVAGHREVLSDWDAQAKQPRAQVLRMHLAPGQPWALERQDLWQA